MAPIRQALQDFIEDSTALSAQLPGGVFEADDLFREGMGAGDIPRDGNNRVLRFMAIRWRDSRPTELYASERQEVEFYIFDQRGYAGIEAALLLLKKALNRTMIPADEGGPFMFHYSFKSGELPDESLGGIPSMFARYYTDFYTD